MPETKSAPLYGRSPAMNALPEVRAENHKDAADLREGTARAMLRLLARKRAARRRVQRRTIAAGAGFYMPITRRSLFVTAGMVPVGLALADCGGTVTPTPTPTVPAWVAGIESIASLIGSALPEFQSVGLSGSALSTVQRIIAGISSAAQAIGATSLPATGASVLTTIEAYLNQLAPVVAPFISLVPGGSIISLVIAALPAIEAAINVVSALIPQAAALAAYGPSVAPAGPALAVGTALVVRTAPAPQDALNELRRRAGR